MLLFLYAHPFLFRTTHLWLDGKRRARRACRVIGDSRAGKTIACDVYRLNNAPQQTNGETPIVPVIYWFAPTETSLRELFVGLLEYLQYRVIKGTLAELRARVYRILKVCQVEMIIIDEAHRMQRKTLSEVRDIFGSDTEVVVRQNPSPISILYNIS